eukprot:1192955-Prorocentrum_minimum.AAC.1
MSSTSSFSSSLPPPRRVSAAAGLPVSRACKGGEPTRQSRFRSLSRNKGSPHRHASNEWLL